MATNKTEGKYPGEFLIGALPHDMSKDLITVVSGQNLAAGAVLGKILLLVFIILFIQKRPRGLFALKGRAVEA